MEIECVGKKIGDDQILIDPSLIDQAEIGSTINLKITVPDQKEKRGTKGLSPLCAFRSAFCDIIFALPHALCALRPTLTLKNLVILH